MGKNSNHVSTQAIIEEAESYAREAIRETYPDARETAEPANAIYEYDAIIIEDETCDVREIAIMHNEASNTFALVERSRAALELAAEAEHGLVIADLLQAVEVKVMMLAQNCRTQDEVAAAWAAISASASQAVRARLHEIGGDGDAAMRQVDRFLLVNSQ